MATLTRYTPATNLVSFPEAVNRLFQDAFTWPSVGFERTLSGVASSLIETTDGYQLRLALPGVDAGKVEITSHKNTVQVKGSYQEVSTPEGTKALWNTLQGGEFSFGFTLPGEIDSEQAAASYTDGILTLTMPKAAHARPRQIKVNGVTPAINGTKTGAVQK